MKDCLFCKIVQGEIPCEGVFETDTVLGFKDISPQAKLHYLFVHKTHTQNINELVSQPEKLTEIFQAIKTFTRESQLEQTGFRVVSNVNSDGGQTVFHTHIHVLGGEALGRFGN